ncbi:thioredoxin domain-containing protein [Aporhodopirellula aestuarii]|uniref:Thioredoxin family protein n=1 Tax=Aporhodopirellula aestuarii TaxID=2950107 RepID=A0ABT0UAB0_9BACT|nr:thioredoxin family protein [Aporhodopirellula aestuarii]MCM2373799.1 thioredoxin family protein [Aporhodopirellula aestuarii]
MNDRPSNELRDEFSPSTPAVTSETVFQILSTHRVVIVHFWAIWNLVDRTMDSRLMEIRGRLPIEVQYASCNVDAPSCFELAKSVGVLNLPWLAVFVGGRHTGSICGLRNADRLAQELLRLISRGPVDESTSD